jgi:tetratricopeptide (TPR) repeat protein
MSLFSLLFLRMAAVAALGATLALACGPFFGIEALQNRKQTLLAPPTVSFENELKALIPPPKDKLPVVEPGNFGQDDVNRATVEARELTPTVLAGVTAMWQQSRGEAARALGEGLPPAIQLYTAGAVSFLHGQTETARAYFQDVLSLPAEERKSRELWAHFMLGRMAVQGGDQVEAAAQFEAVRALVRQGSPDPLGLAVASLGEQARGDWKHGAIAKAVDLYAQQASYGSQSGANSLVMIAGLILKDSKLLDEGIQDFTTRRLLFICLNGNSGRPFFIGPEADGSADSSVNRIVAALERHHLTAVAGAGLLASGAYSEGRFDLAEKLSALEDTPMSAWVTAKLALRRGDRETALKAYERALKIFPAADSTNVTVETAVLRVSRGDYAQALDLFYRAAANGGNPEGEPASNWNGFTNHWGDAAYLAERVLTIEELRDYIDHNLSQTSASTSYERSERSQIRSVLARRLMRAGKYREAGRYFDDQKTRSAAEQYGHAIDRATSWWRLKLTKAEAWFTAATLARSHGMELLGFEREPDYAIWNGDYAPFDFSGDAQAIAEKQGKPADPYQLEDERRRVAASRPERNVRFQYQLMAVDHAIKAADLLPPSSQAFAAVLCEATHWVIDRQPERATQIYGRYLHQGAYVPWGRRFGRQCPLPNFATASGWSAASRQAKLLARHAGAHPVYVGLSAVIAMAILAILFYYGRAGRAGHVLVNGSDPDRKKSEKGP